MENKQKLIGESYTRQAYNSFQAFMDVLPNPDKVLAKTGKTNDAYRDLKNDPHVWSCIQSRKSGLLCLDYMLLPNGCPQNIVNEINEILKSLDVQQLERDIMEAPLFGFQPFEIIWTVKTDEQRLLVPEKVLPKPQEWFIYDNNGELRFRKAGEIRGVSPPPYKIINVQHEASYMNPYGHSLLSKCYWPVTFKNGGLKFWVQFMEKYGMPILMGQYTRGATTDEAEKLASELAGMTEDSVIVAPSDIKVELHEAVRTSSSNLFRDLIKFCNAEISKAILSQTLTTELEMGSYAATLIHYKVRKEVILADIRLVESAIDTLIGYIMDLNFSSQERPKFKILINESDNESRIDRDLKISQTGYVKLTKEYWQNTYGFKEGELEIS